MKVRVSLDRKNWNGNYDCEQSWTQDAMTIALTRGHEEITVVLHAVDAGKFDNGEAMEVVTTALDTIKIKSYQKQRSNVAKQN